MHALLYRQDEVLNSNVFFKSITDLVFILLGLNGCAAKAGSYDILERLRTLHIPLVLIV